MTLHTILSYVKSGIRIVGYISLVFSIPLGVLLLIVAEVFGLLEELPNAYVGTQMDGEPMAAQERDEAERDIQEGRYKTFGSVDELMADVRARREAR